MPDESIKGTRVPSPEAVRHQLQTILGSRVFITAGRARRFLTYIVEQTLAGQADSIKELILGMEVFDRAADFDPKVDPIVRVEAGRLRKRLDEYYGEDGTSSPVQIEIPVGSYVPRFQLREPAPVPAVLEVPETRPRRFPYRIAALALLVVVASCWWGFVRFRAAQAPVNPSIAVLPFLNLSPEPANEYFVDGLAEELTDALCNAGGLRVASRTSAFFFKGKPADVHDIGAKLHVGFVVEGSVRRQGEQLKVTAQLIRTDDGYHVWSGSFERQLADVFAVQQEIAESVVRVLQVKLTSDQHRRLRKTHAANRQAIDLYEQGKHLLNSLEPGSSARAEALFRESIAADPAYALPYLGLGSVYGLAAISGERPAAELFSKGSTAVHKALSLDPELAEAHALLGIMCARYDYDWSAGERHLRHALELNPSSVLAHYSLAQNVFAPQQRWAEANAENRLARELDPLFPIVASGEPWLAMLQKQHDSAVAGYRSLVAASPRNMMALGGLGFALMQKGDYPGAMRVFDEMQSVTPSSQTLALVGYLNARNGNPAATRRIQDQLLARARLQFVPASSFALLSLGLGDTDGAFRHLEAARQQHDGALAFARSTAVWDPIRGDPRFVTLLRNIGLSDEQIPKNQ